VQLEAVILWCSYAEASRGCILGSGLQTLSLVSVAFLGRGGVGDFTRLVGVGLPASQACVLLVRALFFYFFVRPLLGVRLSLEVGVARLCPVLCSRGGVIGVTQGWPRVQPSLRRASAGLLPFSQAGVRYQGAGCRLAGPDLLLRQVLFRFLAHLVGSALYLVVLRDTGLLLSLVELSFV
jgi:hypothetical protein